MPQDQGTPPGSIDHVERYMFDGGPRRMLPFTSFLADAANGTLPSYSFVEPNELRVAAERRRVATTADREASV
jgi:hypothetical protein